ncbi:MFS transporter [Streptomyces sp. A475]|uniref:MFS transporter n=1 Tax=Streptomyces sp. A475 TaxID=3131976 RepID=UPI0030CA0291
MSALDLIDHAPTSGFHRKLLIACCGGPFLDGYILSLIGIALVGFSDDVGTTSVESGLIGAASLIGIFFGATLFGALTDRIGREKMYALDLTVLVVACGLSAFVTAPWQLIALRFIIGLAVGADYPIASSLLTEFTPARKRGSMIGLTGFAWSTGAMSAFLVGYVVTTASGDHHLWRWLLFSGAVAGLVVVLMRRGIPESPRWLLSKGRVEEAREVVRTVYGTDLDPETLRAEAATAAAAQSTTGTAGALAGIVRGGYLKRTIMCGTLYFAQITPQYALYTFGATILAAAGLTGASAATLGELFIAALFALGVLPALRLVETWGRRPMAVVPFAVMAVPLIALGVWSDGPAWFVIAAFAVYAFVSGGPSILEWIYPNELFPTEVRASAVGVAVGISRLGAATGTYLLPIGLDSIGLGPTLLIAAAITVVAYAVCLAWAPETKGRSLAQTSALTPTETRLPERTSV